jgi:hypothetical protein
VCSHYTVRMHVPYGTPAPVLTISPGLDSRLCRGVVWSVSRLDPFVWDTPKRVDVVHSVVRWHLANRRQGTAMVRSPHCAERVEPIACCVKLRCACRPCTGEDGKPNSWQPQKAVPAEGHWQRSARNVRRDDLALS